MSTLLTHGVSSVRSLRPPWRNPRRRSRLFLRASTFPAPDETPLDLTRVETRPPSYLKLSQLRKAFGVCAHVLVSVRAAQLYGPVTAEGAIKPQVGSQTAGATRGAPADGNIALK